MTCGLGQLGEEKTEFAGGWKLLKLKESLFIIVLYPIFIRKCNPTLRKKPDTVTRLQTILYGAARIPKNVEVEQNPLLFLANEGSGVIS